MLGRLLQLILVGVALSRDPDGTYTKYVPDPYLILTYTFSNDAQKVEINVSCGTGVRPISGTFPVTKAYPDTSVYAVGTVSREWTTFTSSFVARCEKYTPLQSGDFSTILYAPKFDHPTVWVGGIEITLIHKELPSH
ncbi:hypothetical protein Pmar_PMAR024276 [Perkinsus marinus ATCC 50983]|uniref:Uncharacterized protein n=1 Tax=Perkinsus marinus (strain ATCC 50983 / TXsc) TaxID=423536 RepID=C5L9B2_PERM5|nr:hypothetical protein Pmar_PMAR024276 [Perkinsus marinus ATCC 50983]EER06683.1 hypothetical protein Pmar_PMAR024276 [Perkinsus marinus ATCC 50983]|eukprot:XP_002774867.1 hypothetical protein Pmar_PMAR024276 [Perkinsus marinus ATCC 50983]